MSVELENQINLNNANDLANAISADAAKVVEVNKDDTATITIQGAIDAQVVLLLERNAEIHQPLQREPGDSNQPQSVPVPVSAEVNDADPTKLIIAFNVNVVDGDGTGYSVSGSIAATTVTAVEDIGSTLTLTLNGAVANGETVVVSYDGVGSLFNADFPTVAAVEFTSFPVINNVAA